MVMASTNDIAVRALVERETALIQRDTAAIEYQRARLELVAKVLDVGGSLLRYGFLQPFPLLPESSPSYSPTPVAAALRCPASVMFRNPACGLPLKGLTLKGGYQQQGPTRLFREPGPNPETRPGTPGRSPHSCSQPTPLHEAYRGPGRFFTT